LRLHRFDLDEQRASKPEVVQHSWAQAANEMACLVYGPLRQMQPMLELLALLSRLERQARGEDLQMLMGGGGHLSDTVVQLVGESAALLLLADKQASYKVGQALLTLC